VKVVGADACRSKWLVVVLEDGQFQEAQLVPHAADVGAAFPDAAAIGIDIPIGLPDEPLRDCEREARTFVGGRRSSVFPTFPERILAAPSYEEAKALCDSVSWPRPSLQSYGMRHGIFEVASFAVKDERVFEVHPEVSFRELEGYELPPKRTSAGASRRRRALQRTGIVLPDGSPFPEDDLLDAAIAAWTALRFARGEAQPFPEDHSERIGAIWR